MSLVESLFTHIGYILVAFPSLDGTVRRAAPGGVDFRGELGSSRTFESGSHRYSYIEPGLIISAQ